MQDETHTATVAELKTQLKQANRELRDTYRQIFILIEQRLIESIETKANAKETKV